MALVIAGTVAPMKRGSERETFRGRVWLGDDGRVDAVTRGSAKGPAGFDSATVVDVGSDAVIYPGFIDLHSHLGYNSLPLWAHPGEPAPFEHRGLWPSRNTYKPNVAWPAWSLMELATESMYAYVQVRAIAGGTTSIQGWPSASRPPTNRIVRSIDDDDPLAVGGERIKVSVETKDKSKLRTEGRLVRDGGTFVYHLAEGTPESNARKEFADLTSGTDTCLRLGFVAIHANALTEANFETWKDKAKPTSSKPSGAVVWSPFSNLWLYGMTTLVPEARAAKVNVTLGCDWGPSGTKNLLGEIKVARLWCDHQRKAGKKGWDLDDHDLVRMITANPGDVLARAWGAPVGRLQRGGLGDVTVLARRPGRNAWSNVVKARDEDVRLVVVGGQPLFGTRELMDAAGAAHTTSVPIGSAKRRAVLVRPDDATKTWAWTDVIGRLGKARAFAKTTPPAGPVAARGRSGPRPAPPSFDPPGTPTMAVRLDMPGGPEETAGPPPKGQTVVVPPIEPLNHDRRWLKSIEGRGFHGTVLDGLRDYYA